MAGRTSPDIRITGTRKWMRLQREAERLQSANGSAVAAEGEQIEGLVLSSFLHHESWKRRMPDV